MFRRLSGTTFRNYVAAERVEAARAALVNTHQSVRQNALAAGFQSISDFNRVFQARVRMTTTQCRKKHLSSVSEI